MQTTTNEKNVPLESGPGLLEIKAQGFDGLWSYAFEHRLPDMSSRLQVRNIKNQILPAQVRKYKLAFERGDAVPAIMVTMDGHLVDGANRTEGARQAGLLTIPAFIIKVNYGTATPSQQRQLKRLGAAMNNMHGQSMTKADNIEQIKEHKADGKTAREIAAEMHISPNIVNSVLATLRGQERLMHLGISPDGLKEGILTEVGYKDDKLTNRVLRPALKVAAETDMSVHDFRALVKATLSRHEEAEKLEVVEGVAQERAHLAGMIRTRRNVRGDSGFNGKLGRALGLVLAVEDVPENTVETNPAAAGQRVQKIKRAISTLEKALHYQQEADRAREESPEPRYNPLLPTRS